MKSCIRMRLLVDSTIRDSLKFVMKVSNDLVKNSETFYKNVYTLL